MDQVSLTVAEATYCSGASPALRHPLPRYRPSCHFISERPRIYKHTHLPHVHTHTSLHPVAGAGDWQLATSWETGCRCNRVASHIHTRRTHAHGAGCHGWPVHFVSMDHLQGESPAVPQWQIGIRPSGNYKLYPSATPPSPSLSLLLSYSVSTPHSLAASGIYHVSTWT